jgi:SARP family transcriptional regulator, regulator of embCAB operon
MKIGIADPQARVRFGLRLLFEQQPGWTVTGEAADSQELLACMQENCPDLVLIDWDLPDMTAGDLLRLLHVQNPPLLVMSMSGRQEMSQEALRAGADGFASKTESPEKLLKLIRELNVRNEKRMTIQPT